MPATASPSTDDGFAASLRRATASNHEQAAMSEYMAALVGGQLDPREYARLVVQHHHVYVELESASVEMSDHPVAGAFVDHRLDRVAAIEVDLQHLLGDGWRDQLEPVGATLDYVERLREVAHTDPARFVAHHYTRYLGDLSGGQFVKGAIAAHLALGRQGAGFYVFDEIGEPREYVASYRTRLDDAAWTADEGADLIEEAIVAYELNRRLLSDLDAELGPRA